MADDAAGGLLEELADDVAVVADELYAVPLDEFVAEREARVKTARAGGDRDLARRVGALAKPTVAAWLLNQLVRHRPAAVEQLVRLGDELRQVQQDLDGAQLRALTQQRQRLVRAFVRDATQLADELGRPLSGPVTDQVEESLRAAVVDQAAGAALLSGRLSAALSYAGLGEVGSSGATPLRSRTRTPTPTARSSPAEAKQAGPATDEVRVARERRRQAARTEVAEAERTVHEAERGLHQAEREQAELADSGERLGGRVQRLRLELAGLEAELAEVTARGEAAAARRDDAATALGDAHAALARARAGLDDLG